MRFGVLGPLSADEDGPVEIRGGQRRTLLAALLLEPNAAVSADRLVDLLWGTKAAAPAGNPLYNQITRLRHALGDTDRIRVATPGYLIQVEPGELDMLEFTECASAGRRARAEQNWPQAAEQFAAALALWRGNPLEDIPALSGDNRLLELEETRIQVLHGRIEADLYLGRCGALAEELPGLVEAHPRHAAFRGQLMLALYRAGRRTEALAAYDVFRMTLAEEIGLEPPAELQELNSAIAREDPALDLAPEPTAARDQRRTDAPRQLPADVRTFTGRDEEFADLLDAAEKAAVGGAAGMLVISALDGMGGIGKTALAVRVAHRVAGRFPDGQLFIDLRGHASAEAVEPGAALAYLLRSLGVPPQAVPDDVAERAALYRSKLADRRTLILLDNAADAEQVRPLLPDTPSALLLITSRSRLAGLEGARSLTLDTLSVPESVSLLRALAGPERDLTESAALLELAELCGYVPLALRIVAARLRHHHDLTVEDLAAELRDEGARLDRLTDGERDLTSVFDSSFANLPEHEANLLRLLGLVPGPDVDVYAAAHLARIDLQAARRTLASLFDRNLLIQQVAGRFGMHDLVRSYIRALIDARSDESRAALGRLLDHYEHTGFRADSRLARATRPGGQDRSARPDRGPEIDGVADALAWMRAERECLLAAISSPAVPAERRVALTAAIAWYLTIDGPRALAAHLHASAARLAAGPGLARANALWDESRARLQTGEFAESVKAGEAAAELYREAGSLLGEANARIAIGRARSFVDGNGAAAMRDYEHALTLFRQIGDRHGEGNALLFMGNATELAGKDAGAFRSLDRALLLLEECGDLEGAGIALMTLAKLRLDNEDPDSSEHHLQRALAIMRSYGNRQNEAAVLVDLGKLGTIQGRFTEAVDYLETGLRTFRGLGYRLGTGAALWRLGRAHLERGAASAAVACLDQARGLFLELGSPLGAVNTLRDLGRARIQAGDAAGRALLYEAEQEYEGLTDPQGLAELHLALGELTETSSGAAAALDRYRSSLDLARGCRSRLDEAHARNALARCRGRLGEDETELAELRSAVRIYRSFRAAALPAAEARLAALEGGDGGVSERPGTEVS